MKTFKLTAILTAALAISAWAADCVWVHPGDKDITYTLGLKLGDVTLTNGYTWVNDNEELFAGNGQNFFATFEDPDDIGCDAVIESIVVNVAQAEGDDILGYAIPSGGTATYGETLNEVNFSTLGQGDGIWAFENISTSVGNAGNQNHTIRFTPTDNINYKVKEVSLIITIAKATGGNISAALTLDGTAGATTLTVEAITAPTDPAGQEVEYGIIAKSGASCPAASSVANDKWQDSEMFISLTPETDYCIYARVKANANFNVGTAAVLEAATTADTRLPSEADAPKPVLASKTGTSITIGAVTLDGTVNGQKPEYIAVRKTGNAACPATPSATNWQSGETFDGFSYNLTYCIYARAAENTSYQAGEPSEALEVTTKQRGVIPSFSISDRTETSVTVELFRAPISGQTVEYAKSSTSTAPASGWQEGLTITGLTAGTTYYIFARSKANDGYDISEVRIMQVKTRCGTGNPYSGIDGCFANEQAAQTACELITTPAQHVWWNFRCYESSAAKTCEEAGKEWYNGTCNKRGPLYMSEEEIFVSKTTTTITLQAPEWLGEQTGLVWQYGYNTQEKFSNMIWGDNATITGLTAGTKYYVAMRAKANDVFEVFNPTPDEDQYYVGSIYSVTTEKSSGSGSGSGGCETSCSGYKPTPILSKVETGNKAAHIANGLSLSVSSGAVVGIYGLKGNLVQSQSYASGEHTMSLNSLPKGMYIVKVSFRNRENTLSHSDVMKVTVK
jgi:hypothetical protein